MESKKQGAASKDLVPEEEKLSSTTDDSASIGGK
jgi:hypothetical protein